MSSNSGSSYAGGIGLPGVLAVVFIVLKLVGVIGWSWWWVLAPLWIPVALLLVFLLLLGIAKLIFGRESKRRGHGVRAGR